VHVVTLLLIHTSSSVRPHVMGMRQVINIGFVPPILRVLYLNAVFFFWSIYLSLVINKPSEDG
jgi:hypothetical protein